MNAAGNYVDAQGRLLMFNGSIAPPVAGMPGHFQTGDYEATLRKQGLAPDVIWGILNALNQQRLAGQGGGGAPGGGGVGAALLPAVAAALGSGAGQQPYAHAPTTPVSPLSSGDPNGRPGGTSPVMAALMSRAAPSTSSNQSAAALLGPSYASEAYPAEHRPGFDPRLIGPPARRHHLRG